MIFVINLKWYGLNEYGDVAGGSFANLVYRRKKI
jgi:hypothetical protein